jgi:hypothetical protein
MGEDEMNLELDDIEERANRAYAALVAAMEPDAVAAIAALQVMATVFLARATYRVAETQEEAHR